MSYKPLIILPSSILIDINIKVESFSAIYAITCNNKMYIGSTNHLKRRIKGHISELINNKHYNKHLQNCYNKYGLDAFNFYILEKLNDDSILFNREQYFIDLYKNQSVFLMNHILDLSNNRRIITSNKKPVHCYDLSGNFIKEYYSIREASKELDLDIMLISSCCRKLQKKTSSYVFFYSDDLEGIKNFINNPYKHLQRNSVGSIKKKCKKAFKKCKRSTITIESIKKSKTYNFYVEVYDFKSRNKLGICNSLRSASNKYNIPLGIIRRNIINDTFIINDYLIRVSKIEKGVLPDGYYYRPLQPGLTIERDIFDELKIVTKFKILKGATLGTSHIKLPTNELLRCEMGGFINTSETPNCTLIETKRNDIITEYVLTTIKDIPAGFEITLDYTKEFCGLNGYKEEEWLKK